MKPEPVGEIVAELGEGPCWDASSGTLLWVDIDGGLVHRTDPSSAETSTLELSPPVSAVLPTADGGLLVARKNRLVLLDPERTVAGVPEEPAIRFNDGKCDPRGRLWIGTMNTDRARGTAALYRLDAGELVTVLEGVTISNGLGWSPDGRTMYYADTPTLRVDAFDYDPETGELSGRRPFVDLDGQGGRPDGLTVDTDGGVWIALVGGGALHRYLPDGKLDAVVSLPVTHPTSCAFGGPELAELYVTTSRALVPEDERAAQPLAGRLFRLATGATGFAVAPVARESF
ncbi:MAG: SMP-30/gluconolactonase/LRE family protein [Pseudonocardiaceae bacterium]|nr:SMP-30/gluconolactonase/LRE family protein [Pseudonocardiaceae bacterium]